MESIRLRSIAPLFYLIWLILAIIQAANTELLDDEAYYWTFSQHLDWGYFDHPPMTALLIRAGYWIFPNELGVRLLCILLSTGSIWLLEKMTIRKEPRLFYAIALSMIALQLGGSSAKLLAEASKIGEDFGYDEINLNLGCPSRKVEKSKFGACLMKEPNLVADCLSKMQASTNLPVTIKTRIGYDNVEDYENLHNFISTLKSTGVKTFIIHARKAMLGKFTPKQNLNIPPLKYEYVYKLKEDFPNEEIIINGGITSVDQINPLLQKTDGVMIGRAAYHTPYMLAEIEKEIFGTKEVLSRQDVIEQLIPYVKDEIKKGTRLNQIMRHTIGLFHGQTGASYWKRYLSENMCVRDADVKKIDHIMDKIKYNNIDTSVGQTA